MIGYIFILFFIIVYSCIMSQYVVMEQFGLTSFVTGIADGIVSPVKNIVNSAKTKINDIHSIMEDTGNIISTGFDLLRTSIELLSTAGQILYLLMLKMKKCYYGFEEVYQATLEQLETIKNNIQETREKIHSCISIRTKLSGPESLTQKLQNYKTDCLSNWGSCIDNIKGYISQFKQILSNQKLFALNYETTEGQSKEWCTTNYRPSATLSYSTQCNQCFNFNGLFSKEFTQLADIEKLVTDSEKILANVANIMTRLKDFSIF